MELNEAIEIMLDANNGKRPVPVIEFVEATDVVLDAMRKEITMSEAVTWCMANRPKGEENE